MALILIYCPNESCNHCGFVSVETLPRVLTCSSCGRRNLHAPVLRSEADTANPEGTPPIPRRPMRQDRPTQNAWATILQ